MPSFESIQRRIDNRFEKAQKNMDSIAMSNQGSQQDMLSFLSASKKWPLPRSQLLSRPVLNIA